MRRSGRQVDELRKIVINRKYTRHAEGSVLICCGDTHVLCNASVEDRVPSFLRGQGKGWVTAEYGMLPRSTSREASRGKQGGRTLEIQRLIGRSLRAVVDREALGERTITLDCDVLQADGGTRTASITGAYVALVDACPWRWLMPANGYCTKARSTRTRFTDKLPLFRLESLAIAPFSISTTRRIRRPRPI